MTEPYEPYEPYTWTEREVDTMVTSYENELAEQHHSFCCERFENVMAEQAKSEEVRFRSWEVISPTKAIARQRNSHDLSLSPREEGATALACALQGFLESL